jgi:hypothetical protein
MTDKKDETAERVAQLEKELAELKAKVSPPEPKPFVPQPYQRYDPTAGMTMPPSALRAMVDAVPDHVMRGIVHDNRAPTGRPGMIPEQQISEVRRGAGDGTGWAREIPIGPSMHQRYVDQQLDAQDAKDRAELIKRDAQLKALDQLAENKP